MKLKKQKKKINYILFIFYLIFVVLSWTFNYQPGVQIGINFTDFVKSMFKILPFAFILIGLFEVWVKRETVEKYLGHASGCKGYFWAIILSSTTVGGAYVAFPVAYSLYSKGAKLSVVLTYIGSSAITRIPMSIFEASFLGIKFTLIRLFVSIPLVILTSWAIGKRFYLKPAK